VGEAYPPSTQSLSPQFRIGKDSHGRWVVQDERGLCGGLFINRAEALKFALFENGHHPQAVIMVPGVFELNLAQRVTSPTHRPTARQSARAA
jgi:hypothetical protein